MSNFKRVIANLDAKWKNVLTSKTNEYHDWYSVLARSKSGFRCAKCGIEIDQNSGFTVVNNRCWKNE